MDLEEGVIVAKRHIHMTPEDAANFGVQNGEIVAVLVDTGKGRATIFGDTVIRVSPKYALAMHIDTDECNACCGSGEVYGELIHLQSCDCEHEEGHCCCGEHGHEEGHCCCGK